MRFEGSEEEPLEKSCTPATQGLKESLCASSDFLIWSAGALVLTLESNLRINL
jgi:hypothetical protein